VTSVFRHRSERQDSDLAGSLEVAPSADSKASGRFAENSNRRPTDQKKHFSSDLLDLLFFP
jgi:hypothetical protein